MTDAFNVSSTTTLSMHNLYEEWLAQHYSIFAYITITPIFGTQDLGISE